MNYPLTADTANTANTANGDFVVGQFYKCTFANPKAKKGENGQPRFTEGMVYMCIANSSSCSETNDNPPTFLVDNGYRAVSCGSDAKLKSTFVLHSA